MSCKASLRAEYSNHMAGAGRTPTSARDSISSEIRRFAQRSLQSSATIFYWVENGVACGDAEVSGLPETLWSEYLAEMVELDPLSVRAMVDAGSPIARLPGRRSFGASAYEAFLERHRVRDVVDMLFSADGVVFAGLGVIKLEGDAPLSIESLDLANAMRPLIEASLQRHERVRRALMKRRLTSRYQLTSREIDVAELVAEGCSNDEVADSLSIRLPTVKSHLLSVFSKTGSANRTELARLLLE